MKFRTRMNQAEKEEMFNQNARGLSPAERDYIQAYQGNPQIVPNYQVKWNSILQEEILGEILPELVQGKITAEEFTRKEDESIQKFEEEQ